MNHPSTVRRRAGYEKLVCFIKKTTQTKPSIEIMELLLHQVSWPAILDLEGMGSGPSFRPILLFFAGIFRVFPLACTKF